VGHDVGVIAHDAAMAGDGFYNAHSPQQAEVAAMSEDALRRAVEMLPASVNATVIADYGCSQGGNSIRPMRVVLDAMRQRTPIRSAVGSPPTCPQRLEHSGRTVFGPNSCLDDHESSLRRSDDRSTNRCS
jgi:hypothetical protein